MCCRCSINASFTGGAAAHAATVAGKSQFLVARAAGDAAAQAASQIAHRAEVVTRGQGEEAAECFAQFQAVANHRHVAILEQQRCEFQEQLAHFDEANQRAPDRERATSEREVEMLGMRKSVDELKTSLQLTWRENERVAAQAAIQE